jgi:adenylate cyclase, class 2
MTNIEVKARCDSFERIEARLTELGAGLAGVFEQSDTYFRVPRGRLKLRESGPDEGQLIHYERPDTQGPKRSDYQVAHTTDPAAMRAVLAALLGTWLEVVKRRQIWLWENVRIHLDEVRGLGRFVELEAVTEDQGVETSRTRVEYLMEALALRPNELIPGSYSDLVDAAGQAGRDGQARCRPVA